MTYTVVIPDARHVSTILDALNTHCATLQTNLSQRPEMDPIVKEWFLAEIERSGFVRGLLLATNSD